MKKKIFFASFGILLSLALTGNCQERKFPPYIVASLIEKAPVMDGSLNDPVWEKAAKVNLEEKYYKSAPIPKGGFGTTVYFLHTDDALYLGVRARNPFAPVLKTADRLRDSNIYMDECVEIFIDPRNGQTGRQFVINASACQYDGLILRGGSWTGVWQAKTKISRGVWTAEMKIPFSDLDGKPPEGKYWTINCCHAAYDNEGGKCWIQVLREPGYHSPAIPLFMGPIEQKVLENIVKKKK